MNNIIVERLIDGTRGFSESDSEDYKIGYMRVFVKSWKILQFSPNRSVNDIKADIETFTAGIVLNTNLSNDYARGAISACKEVIAVVERNEC